MESAADSFLFGSLFLWVGAFLLASFWELRSLPGWAWLVLFFPGVIFSRQTVLDFLRAFGERRVFGFAAILVFSVRALTAAIPAQHGDPLLYHLLGPRIWAEAGGFTMNPDLPNALLASSWEVLYLWPQMFWMSVHPLFGLIEAQLFSQWLHLFLAWGGSALLVMRMMKPGLNSKWLPLAGFAALFVSGLQWTAALAKNDVGIAFWVLGAIVFFAEGFKNQRLIYLALSGVFGGLALSGKVTALLSLAPLLAALFFYYRPWNRLPWSLGAFAVWGSGLLLGAVPIYVRNFVLSGNPFFPLFSGVFPSPWLSKSWESHFSQVHPASHLDSIPRLWMRFPELWRENPFLTVVPLFALSVLGRFLLRRSRLEAGNIPALAVGGLAAYGVFVVTQAAEIELRYLGASLQLLAAIGVFVLIRWSTVTKSGRLQAGAASLIFIGIFVSSKLPLHVLYKIWSSPLGVEMVKTHSAGEAKAWLRKHASGSFTIVAADNETYYLTPLSVAVLTERPDLDAATRSEKDFGRFIEAICTKSGAKYLLDARPFDPNGVEARFGTERLAPAKVYSAQGANIYALSVLERLYSARGPSCQ